MTHIGQTIRIAGLSWLVSTAVVCSAARGDSGHIVSLPTPRTIPASGLNIDISWQWCDVAGLRPVRIVVNRLDPPYNRDRTIRVEISPFRYDPKRRETTVFKQVDLPAGKSVTETFIYVPERREQRAASIEVFEGGRRLRDLSVSRAQVTTNNNDSPDGFPAILVIDYDCPHWNDPSNRAGRSIGSGDGSSGGKGNERLPDMRTFVESFPHSGRTGIIQQSSAALSADEVLRELPNWVAIDMMHPADLASNWIALSGIDLIFVTLDDLRNMQDDYPERWRAVESWLWAGGNLVVLGAGPQLNRLGEIDDLLGLASIANNEASRDWGKPPRLDDDLNLLRDEDDAEAVGTQQSTNRQRTLSHLPKLPPRAGFVHRHAGLGSVAAFNEEHPFPGDQREWQTLLNTLDDWLWYRRHGMSLMRDNEGFWRFIIAGVGLAPVNLFRIMIVLFVVMIGPINYVLLRRMRRLSWMLATVPIGALLATSSLFVYAAVTDGFHVRNRSRSLTHIDQRRGHAATWSRQAYYAGLAPSGGLVFPADAAVFPFLQAPSYDFQRSHRRLEWREDKQILARGYLQSRVMSQFMVIRSRPSPLRLDIGTTETDSLTAANHLGSVIQQLYVCDEDSQLHGTSKKIAAGAVAQLTRQQPADAQVRMAELIRKHPLVPPPGFDEDSYSNVLNMNRGYFFRYHGHRELPGPSPMTSILEQRLAQVQQPETLGPRSYVAVVESCAEVPLGIATAKQQQTLYVVTGAW